MPADQVKDKMITLDARRKTLETQLSATPADDPLRFHPSMAKTYRDRVATLIRALGDAEGMEEAKEVVRSLIDRIVLTPAPDGKSLTIDLEGALAGLLSLATDRPLQEVRQASDKQKTPGGERGAVDIIGELVLVAGTGIDHNLQSTPVKMVAGGRYHLYLRPSGGHLPVAAAPDTEEASAEGGNFLSALFRTAA